MLALLLSLALANEPEPEPEDATEEVAEEVAEDAAEEGEPSPAPTEQAADAAPTEPEPSTGKRLPRDRSTLARRLPRAELDLRTLKYHPFIAAQGFDDAFVTSSFGLSTGAAFLSLPGFDPGDGSDPYDLFLVGANEQIVASVQFIKWVMLYAEVTGDLVVGVNVPSALDRGASAGADWDTGVGVKLFRIKKTGTQMSVRAKFVGEEGLRLRPDSVIEALDRRTDGSIEDLGDEELATILLGSGDLGGGASVNLAQAFGSWGSLQASVEGRFGQTRQEVVDASDQDDVRKVTITAPYVDLRAGAALTFDGWPYFPVGLQLEYDFGWNRIQFPGENSDFTTHDVGGGLFYTGHPDFVIGLRGSAVVATSLVTQPLAASAGLMFRVYL